ncbi:hypothetical protein A2U01_0059524, partial [Trifolium medium]|nr:hypothetical protein [Trifolium medium]
MIVEHVEVDSNVDIKNNSADFNDDTIVVHESTRAKNQTHAEGANSDSEEDINILVEPMQEYVPKTQLELNVTNQSTGRKSTKYIPGTSVD